MRYEYECKEHGVFSLDRPLDKYKEPVKCPKCPKKCKRVLATALPKSQSWRA